MNHLSEDQLIACYYREPEFDDYKAHLAQCDNCTAALDQLGQELALLEDIPSSALPDDLGYQVWERLAPQLAATKQKSLARTWIWAGLAAAAIVAAFLLGRLKPIEPWSIAETPAQERILNSKLNDHLERSTQILGQIGEDPVGEADAEALQWLLRNNRMYRQVLTQSQQPETVSVLEDLEFLLLRLKHPDPETKLPQDLSHDVHQLLEKLRTVKNQIPENPSPPITNEPRL